MFVRFQGNGVTFRALGALCAAIALAAVLVMDMREKATAREIAIYSMGSNSWKISELVFENQRLSTALFGYADQSVSKDEIELRFDLLWSRVDVLRNSEIGAVDTIREYLDLCQQVLEAAEPMIYDAQEIKPADIKQMIAVLQDLALEARRVWQEVFAKSDGPLQLHAADKVFAERNSQGLWRHMPGFATMAMMLIVGLMFYVLFEVYAANHARKREIALRTLASQASEAKSRFLANVSHEIRTPLNGILGMASELGETNLDTDQATCLRVIEQSGSVLLGTINDVLDLSRVESGQMQVENRPFVLSQTLDAARALYSAKAREKNLRLDLFIQDDLPTVIVGDERRLQQVMHNLIANAIKFTADGSVTIRAVADEAGKGLSLLVRDTGPGIPVHAHSKIFAPFSQADASVTRVHGGTGLGLAISRQLCEAMGGNLKLVSREGHGATFICELPLIAADPDTITETKEPGKTAPDLTGQRILVADDNATNRLIIQRFLKATSAEITQAKSGEEAVELSTQSKFDVILMDIQMPGMDGVTATQTIRQLERVDGTARHFIVAVTANVLMHQVQEYRDAGMDDVLAKPVSKQDLFDLLYRHRYATAA